MSTHMFNLYVGYRNIEVFVHRGIPHQPDIGDDETTQISLSNGTHAVNSSFPLHSNVLISHFASLR